MKLIPYLASLAILTFGLSISAFAKSSNSGSFDLFEAVQIGSAHLAPGHYKAEWNGPSNNVNVTILQNGKTVATVEGHIKDLPERSSQNSVTLKTVNDTQRIDEIEFDHSTEALQFAD
jgi:hypothetical protein